MPHTPSGHIEQLPSGFWRAKVYAGKDPLTGREIRFRKTCKTERDAQIELGKLLALAQAGRQPDSDVTLPPRPPFQPGVSADRLAGASRRRLTARGLHGACTSAARQLARASGFVSRVGQQRGEMSPRLGEQLRRRQRRASLRIL